MSAEMKKVVINLTHKGFSLSKEGLKLYKEKSGNKDYTQWDIRRDDPYLVEVVEELKHKAFSEKSYLRVIKLPKDAYFVILNMNRGEETLVWSMSAVRVVSV